MHPIAADRQEPEEESTRHPVLSKLSLIMLIAHAVQQEMSMLFNSFLGTAL